MKPADWDKQRQNPNSRPARLPREYCKKLKGKHQFELERVWLWPVAIRHKTGEIERYQHLHHEYRCSGCGKKKRTLEEVRAA